MTQHLQMSRNYASFSAINLFLNVANVNLISADEVVKVQSHAFCAEFLAQEMITLCLTAQGIFI